MSATGTSLPRGLCHIPGRTVHPLQPLPVNAGLWVGHWLNCWACMELLTLSSWLSHVPPQDEGLEAEEHGGVGMRSEEAGGVAQQSGSLVVSAPTARGESHLEHRPVASYPHASGGGGRLWEWRDLLSTRCGPILEW